MNKQILFLLVLISTSSWSQNIIISDTIYLSTNNMINVLFPEDITGEIDFNKKVYAKISSKRALSLRAKEYHFNATNLNVATLTAYYTFILVYTSEPPQYVYAMDETKAVAIIGKSQEKDTPLRLSPSNTIPEESEQYATYDQQLQEIETIAENAKTALAYPQKVRTVAIKKDKMILSMTNIFTDGKHLYVTVNIQNQSYLPFTVDFFRFVIRQSNKLLNSNSNRQKDVPLIYEYSTYEGIISSKSNASHVFVFRNFTIDKSEAFWIELEDKNGSRHLAIHADYKTILNVNSL